MFSLLIGDLVIILMKSASYIGCKYPLSANILIEECVYELFNYRSNSNSHNSNSNRIKNHKIYRTENMKTVELHIIL